MIPISGLLWSIVLLVPLMICQRLLHLFLQRLLLLLTRRVDLTVAIFSLLFLPGVTLHEASHFVMAKLLGVRTGKFSLLPRNTGPGRLQLGFVETEETDFLRDALIGAAPFFSGALFVSYIGLIRLGFGTPLAALSSGDGWSALGAFANLASVPDFWLWFYLAFTISSTMMPSPSDRRAWVPVGMTVIIAVGLAWFAGAGDWMLTYIAPPFESLMQALATTLGISVLLHMVLLPPIWLAQVVLLRLLGYPEIVKG